MPVPLFASSLDRYQPRLTERIAEVVAGRALHPGPRGARRSSSEFARLPGRAPLHRRGQRHRRAGDRPARARRGARRRGRAALLHLLRHRRGGGGRRRGAGVLRRRPAHVLRDGRDGPGRHDAAHQGGDRRPPVRQRGADGRARGSWACRCSRTRRRRPGPSWTAAMAGALGDAATFSFFPSKNLPCLGDGGAVVTDDDEVAKLARRLRFHGSDDKQTFVEVGYNSRLDELQAAALRVLLPELDGWNAARRDGGRGLRARRASASTSTLPEPVDGRRARLPPVRGPPRARGRAGRRAERRRRRRPRLLPRARRTASRRWPASPPRRRTCPGPRRPPARTWRCRWAPS